MAQIAFVSTYPPRQCGIATYTADLGRAIGTREIVALRRPDEPGRFESEVHHVMRTDVRGDHARVAASLVDCGVRIVSLQHEYGIWGGDDGDFVLDFLDALGVPAVATLHTVPCEPTASQEEVMRGILGSTRGVVVMSQAAAAILARRYGADPGRVEVIPHGVPDLPFVASDTIKPAVGLAGRQVLLTFGLLRPGKGCEHVIEAMPEVVRAFPNACYVILGATHPDLVRSEGEQYRRRLEARAAELGVVGNVLFVDRFVGRTELGRWLEAADVVVTPNPDLDQSISGTLSYAMAAGRATVSTPSLYASEVLAGGCGLLVPPGSTSALASALVGLLADDELRGAMALRAYAHGRGMTWSHVASRYAQSFALAGSPMPSSRVTPVPVHSA